MPAAGRIDCSASDAWRRAYPGACVGLLQLDGVRNPDADEALDRLLDETASNLRERYGLAGRPALLAVPELAAYAAYYRRFDKTYHVLLQLESVAFKGKPLRARGALVGAMFRAELETGLLTAGHDAAFVEGALVVDLVSPGDRYVGIGGREVEAAPGDMAIRDGVGIVSSIVYGPDDRTRLRDTTERALFTTYAPAGVGPAAVRRELGLIADGVRRVSPSLEVVSLEIVEA